MLSEGIETLHEIGRALDLTLLIPMRSLTTSKVAALLREILTWSITSRKLHMDP